MKHDRWTCCWYALISSSWTATFISSFINIPEPLDSFSGKILLLFSRTVVGMVALIYTYRLFVPDNAFDEVARTKKWARLF